MTTRSGSRIYRGVGRRKKPGSCPVCFQRVQTTATGTRRAHVDEAGAPCPGAGTKVGEPTRVVVLPPELLEQIEAGAFVHSDRWGKRRRDVPASKWSGKP